jgi:hypothetical protein
MGIRLHKRTQHKRTQHKRTQPVALASSAISLALWEMQDQHGLTDVEMLQALASHQQSMLKYMLRAERHPEDPDKRADEA